MKKVIYPVFVPHMGCPHQCVFCNQFRITGQWTPPSLQEMEENVVAWQKSSGVVPELAFYGGSFTAIDLELQETMLEMAAQLKQANLVSAIRLSTRPDALEDEILVRLRHYQVDTVEIGVQSLNDEVLALSERGHSAAQAREAIERVKAAGLSCGAQMMVGLVGDTPLSSLTTCKEIIALRPDFVRIYPTAVIRGTKLETMYQEGTYLPWDFDTCLDTVADMKLLFDEAEIPIIRIGLQPEDNLDEGDVVAGLYHPALGELVKARVFRKKMQALLQENEEKEIIFAVAEKQLSQALGQHRDNIHWLEEKTGQEVKIIANNNMTMDTIERR